MSLEKGLVENILHDLEVEFVHWERSCASDRRILGKELVRSEERKNLWRDVKNHVDEGR